MRGTALSLAIILLLLARADGDDASVWYSRAQIAQLRHRAMRGRLTPHEVRVLDRLVEVHVVEARRAASAVVIVDFRWEYRPGDLLRPSLYSVMDGLGPLALDVWRLLERSSSPLPIPSIAHSVAAGRVDALMVPLRTLQSTGIVAGATGQLLRLCIPYPVGL